MQNWPKYYKSQVTSHHKYIWLHHPTPPAPSRDRASPLCVREEVGLVDQQQIEFVLADLLHVPLEVLATEQQGVPRVHDLHHNVTANRT